MANKFTTTKLWTKTLKLARIVSAYLGEPVAVLIHRLLEQEAADKNIPAPPLPPPGK